MIRLCFVCLGNICRSPTAEGIMKKLVADNGLEKSIFVDSAGTGAYHVGELPDKRGRKVAKKNGVTLDSRARKFVAEDLESFDYILVMDKSNRKNVLALAENPTAVNNVYLLRHFNGEEGSEVPDPYYGGPSGFEHVFDVCLNSCESLLQFLMDNHTELSPS